MALKKKLITEIDRSVLTGLIGLATPSKDGLIPKHNAQLTLNTSTIGNAGNETKFLKIAEFSKNVTVTTDVELIALSAVSGGEQAVNIKLRANSTAPNATPIIAKYIRPASALYFDLYYRIENNNVYVYVKYIAPGTRSSLKPIAQCDNKVEFTMNIIDLSGVMDDLIAVPID